jgi:putative peptide zinc metalloprotease protein
VHHGCRVPTLGIAFILGAPLLYIDVTDSWRLPSRRARLAIDAAGIAVDLAISALATLAWAFLPDGALRDTAFFLATAGWITSLAFNLNPFMKFDGYHLLADALPLPNLQDRAIAVAQWRLRELLFALRHPAPEKLTPRLQNALCIYGWAIAIYRVVLFTAIAIAVYRYFFKLLGIVLFLVEIGYFIVAPLVRELKVWADLRGPILASRRTTATAVVLGVLLVLLVVPWSTSVTVPAVVEPTDVARLHSPHPARIVGLGADTGASIEAGARLVRLASPKLEHDLTLARLQAAVVDLRLSRLASDPADREQALVLQQQRLALARAVEGIHKQIDALAITAPLSGTVASLVPHAAVGRWIVASEPVAVVHGARDLRVRGLVEAVDRPRIRPGMPARFVPSDILAPSLDARVASVATANSATLDILELADSFGGAIPTSLAADGRAVPLQAQYAVIASLDANRAHPHQAEPHWQPRVGVLIVYGDAQSLAQRFWNRILQVLVRESGL